MISPLRTRAVRATTVAIFLAGCVLPASAKMTVIRELGTAPLLGPSSSTAQMRDRVEKNQTLLREAALKSGLTAGQFQEVNEAIAASRVQWVTVPRHLTVMTWRSGTQVYVIRDVKIPPGVGGWKVDLKERNSTVAVYLPAKCGNLSYVRSRPDLAAVPPQRKPKAIAAVVPAAIPVPPAPIVAADPVVPAAAAPAAPVSPAAVAHSTIGGIAAVAGALIGAFGAGGGGGGGGGGSFHSPVCI